MSGVRPIRVSGDGSLGIGKEKRQCKGAKVQIGAELLCKGGKVEGVSGIVEQGTREG